MDQLIDIHTHILPSIDDGARDMEEAIQMLCMAWDDGIGEVVLTPHYRGAYKKIPVDRIWERFEQLTEAARRAIPGMKLHLGRELHYEQDLYDKLCDGDVMPFANTQYVLLEFSTVSRRSQIVQGVENVCYSGHIPIVAHVERYNVCRDDKKLIDELLDMGALIQMNADSIMGENGWSVRRFCHKLLRAQKVHFIASDAHRTDWRPPLLKKCWERVSRKYGQEYAEQVFRKNARNVLENREMYCRYERESQRSRN